MKDERLAEIRELLNLDIPSDPANLQEHTKLVRLCLHEALEEIRLHEEKAGGDFGRALREMMEERIAAENTGGRELPPCVEVITMSLHFTSEYPIVDVRMKLVPSEELPNG